MRKHFLDLFSGLGGASEAFVQDVDNWSVLRIDNNPLLGGVPFTVIDDINNVIPKLTSKWHDYTNIIDCIWASPPCREFSNAYSSPKSIWGRNHGLDSYEPDMSLLEASMEIINAVKPKYWIVENVVGSIRYFEEYLGAPRQIIGPYVLWGNFPLIDVDPSLLESKSKKDVHSSNPLRSNYKAKVDFEISSSLKTAIEFKNQYLISSDYRSRDSISIIHDCISITGIFCRWRIRPDGARGYSCHVHYCDPIRNIEWCSCSLRFIEWCHVRSLLISNSKCILTHH